MKKYFTKFIVILILSFILIGSPVFSQGLKDAFTTTDPNADEEGKSGRATPLSIVSYSAGYDPENNIDSMVGKMIFTALSLLGIIFLILLIYAGYLWMTASGNEQQVEKAKSMITAAMIGLIIVLSAYSILILLVHIISILI